MNRHNAIVILGEPISEVRFNNHLPHPNARGGYVTLCGWVDVEYKTGKEKANCPLCLQIVDFCKNLEV